MRYTPPHQRGSADGSGPSSAAARSLGEVDSESGVYLQVSCSKADVPLIQCVCSSQKQVMERKT